MQSRTTSPVPEKIVEIYTKGKWHQTPIFDRANLQPGDEIVGPAIIVEPTGTNIIEPDWVGTLTEKTYLILTHESTGITASAQTEKNLDRPDPVKLEIFNNLLKSIAEEMGIVLQNTSYSVNIKERLDFSCAIFDRAGQLIANAPHIPVHLGSMSETVTSLIQACGQTLKPGDVYISNNPYNGGTHLPDITAITPIFLPTQTTPIFYVASRGHHTDLGGITPGSMPPHSTSIEQEGILNR